MRIKHLAVEVVRDVGEGVEDAGFIGDGCGLDVNVVKVLFLKEEIVVGKDCN